MALTPLDIQNKTFPTKMRGYNQDEVDDFLDLVVRDYEEITQRNRELEKAVKHSEEKLEYCKKFGMPVSEYERKNPELLHAKLGACFANTKYGISDPEILSAITWHTTGKPDMDLLDKIVFVADYMEPNRNQAPDLAEVRKLAFQNLDQCLFLILKDTIDYLAGKKSVTDPMTQRTYDYYEKELCSL